MGLWEGMGHRDGEQSSANVQEERKDPGKNGGVGQAWRVQALCLCAMIFGKNSLKVTTGQGNPILSKI